jgi:hypothetical protein
MRVAVLLTDAVTVRKMSSRRQLQVEVDGDQHTRKRSLTFKREGTIARTLQRTEIGRMKCVLALLAAGLFAKDAAVAFVPSSTLMRSTRVWSAVSDVDAVSSPAPVKEDEYVAIPTSLPSEKGVDYVPLATLLATGNFKEADQVSQWARAPSSRTM